MTARLFVYRASNCSVPWCVTDDQRWLVDWICHVQVWGRINGQLLQEIVGHTDAVKDVFVTGSGRALMTASADTRVHAYLFLEARR